MACGVKIWYLMSIMLALLLNFLSFVCGEPQVSCYFIFGDSLVDNGNNNVLDTLANVNFSPYGIDFPTRPIGRFTNGRTQADIIGELLGFDSFIPPFAIAIGSDILKGVNYASGGAGIRSETAKALALYEHEARKVAIHGLGQIGCSPAELATRAPNGSACVDTINNAVQLFDKRLKPLVDDLNKDLHDAKFIYINTTSITSGNLSALGITVLNVPCYQVSTTTRICIPGQAPCSNRTEYAFWDSFHPTEKINLISARRAYNALLPTDTYPIDIHHLAKL